MTKKMGGSRASVQGQADECNLGKSILGLVGWVGFSFFFQLRQMEIKCHHPRFQPSLCKPLHPFLR